MQMRHQTDHTNIHSEGFISVKCWHDCNINDWGKQGVHQGSQWSWYWTKIVLFGLTM